TTTTTTTTTTSKTTTTTTSTTPAPQPSKLGDANCDGVVDISDVILVSRIGAEDKAVSLTFTGKLNADCNDDNKVGADDALMILKAIARLITL
ncbi:MAG: dockerin type I repeat-containing protein, partial [Oscillospiraceae bacterium]|nr:dockerin type I repeat-containing protein [Oscillospiraceae bacterium]